MQVGAAMGFKPKKWRNVLQKTEMAELARLCSQSNQQVWCFWSASR
jgi:hypothetical protein